MGGNLKRNLQLKTLCLAEKENTVMKHVEMQVI